MSENDLEKRIDQVERELRRIQQQYEEALSFSNSHPKIALSQARIALEAICKQIYESEGLAPHGHRWVQGNLPTTRMELDALIKAIEKTGIVPKIYLINMCTVQHLGNYGSHDQGYEAEYISAKNVKTCLEALSTVVDWYFQAYHKRSSYTHTVHSSTICSTHDGNTLGLAVLTIADLHARGRTTGTIIDDLIGIDYRTLSGAQEQDVGTTNSWEPIVDNNTDGMRFVVDSDSRIIAYWHFLPLNDDAYLKAKSGIMDDGTLTLSDMNIIGPPGDYNMYFMIISVMQQFRGVKVLRLLLDAFVDDLLELARLDIYFPEMCATSFTDEGDALCRTLKMQAVMKHKHRGTVYSLPLKNCPDSLFYREELRQRYVERYKTARAST